MANKTTAFVTIPKEKVARILTLEVSSYEVTKNKSDRIVIEHKSSGVFTSYEWRATVYDWKPTDPTQGEGARLEFKTEKAHNFRKVLKHEVE